MFLLASDTSVPGAFICFTQICTYYFGYKIGSFPYKTAPVKEHLMNSVNTRDSDKPVVLCKPDCFSLHTGF